MLRPLIAPDAFVRAYLGERGAGHVLVRRVRAARLWLQGHEHAVVELCNGERTEGEIARQAGEAIGRGVGAREVARLIARLAESGAVIDAAVPPRAVPMVASPRGIARLRLDDARVAAMRLSLPPRFGFACDGRGACCRLYDLVAVREADVAALEEAYGEAGHLPGGLALRSGFARHRGDSQRGLFALAAIDGACVLLGGDGRCGVHRLLGADRKPAACAAYPLRDVLCGDELAIGVAVTARRRVYFPKPRSGELRPARCRGGRRGIQFIQTIRRARPWRPHLCIRTGCNAINAVSAHRTRLDNGARKTIIQDRERHMVSPFSFAVLPLCVRACRAARARRHGFRHSKTV